MKKLLLVANSPDVHPDIALGKGFDFVVRFNLVPDFLNNPHARTDALCMVNTGPVGQKIYETKFLLNTPLKERIREVWFLRDGPTARVLSGFGRRIPQDDYIDHSDAIIEENDLRNKIIIGPDREMYSKAHSYINKNGGHRSHCPSTGFLAMHYILNSGRFDGYHKFITGFSHTGWTGHPRETEKMITDIWVRERVFQRI